MILFNPPLAAELLGDGDELAIESAAIAVHAYGYLNGERRCVVTDSRGLFIDANPAYVRVIDARVAEALATATAKMQSEREPEQAP